MTIIGRKKTPETASHDFNVCKTIELDLSNVWLAGRWLTFRKENPFLLSDKVENDTCHLCFCLYGGFRTLDSNKASNGLLNVPTGNCAFIFHPTDCRCRTCSAPGASRIYQIQFSGHDLLNLIGLNELGEKLLSARTKGAPLTLVAKTTPTMAYVLRQMEIRKAEDDNNTLFWMVKTMELIMLFADSLEQRNQNQISVDDRKAVEKAQTILENRMSEPPSLEELAMEVGMSVSKFKKIFPRKCGRTPYAYLRQVRMERSLHLIQCGDKSVTEAAFEVGYNSLSRFSKAFADHFGFRPSEARYVK